ncbi:unnamed protein product [Musa acuminata subsp. malaccensis]|uniref:(wild Malaysian banana) hypothetical protein n=1 Tax=Musa acuminata subsp. malaccensis TaxID=214687 RepID=A0A804J740_MUSAM|nr:PREDICTED: UPF0415 protein C7orf25 homolog [Musa acuminata subsp. malaccensis]CAG1839202.1 unnamed protein product [Musa acuminata subsp. malaccensis]
MPLKANLHRAATGGHQIREAESRCLAVRHRLLQSDIPPSSYISLLRLLDAELRSLSRLASSALSLPLSSNVGYLESIARLLLHPSVRCVSRVSRPVPAACKDHPVHVDLVCTLHRRPAWFVVSDRNPVYLSWLGPKGLRARVERVIAAARSAGPLKPTSVLFVFSRGIRDHVSDNLVDEFGAVEVGLLNDEEDVFEELDDGWIGVRWSGSSNSRVFEVKIALDDGRDACRSLEVVDEREEVGVLDDGFGSLVSRIDVDSADVVNFDTTALIAMVSGISNGGCERLMKAPEAEMRARFKGNYEFVMAQVTSELEHPILAELSIAIAGKKGIICESVLSEFQELVSMCAGPNESLRADQLIKHLQVVPDSPSERLVNLPTTRKIALKNKIVFGTGDHWHAPTLTANTGFVRAVSQTSMSLLTIEHRPRALTGD